MPRSTDPPAAQPSERTRVAFDVNVGFATLRETWECSVPNEILNGERDELHDYLNGMMGSADTDPDANLNFISQESNNEEGRDIIVESIEPVGPPPPALKPVVLIVRDPDYENEITVTGDVEVIDIDLGRSFGGPKRFNSDLSESQQKEWLRDTRHTVEHLPPEHPARQVVEKLCSELEDDQ